MFSAWYGIDGTNSTLVAEARRHVPGTEGFSDGMGLMGERGVENRTTTVPSDGKPVDPRAGVVEETANAPPTAPVVDAAPPVVPADAGLERTATRAPTPPSTATATTIIAIRREWCAPDRRRDGFA
jgi:hypothetical protein